MARVLVSGAGPTGMLAALALYHRGHTVRVVEKRSAYTRGIVHQLRASFLWDLDALDADIGAGVRAIAAPMTARDVGRLDDAGHASWRRAATTDAPAAEHEGFGARLGQRPTYTVRIDALERTLRAGLEALDETRMQLHVGAVALTPADDDVRASGSTVQGPTLFATNDAELIVVAEGGKPQNAAALGVVASVLSAPRFYMNLNVPLALGAVVRRMDSTTGMALVVGHRDPAAGVWGIVEAPRTGAPKTGRGQIVRDVFAARLRPLCEPEADGAAVDKAIATALTQGGLFGTFRFAQQMLAVPVYGRRVVFFGDAAGMGHPATSGALEAAIFDTQALSVRAERGPEPAAQAAYAERIRNVRLTLLEHGIGEYPAQPGADLRDVVARAVAARAVAAHRY